VVDLGFHGRHRHLDRRLQAVVGQRDPWSRRVGGGVVVEGELTPQLGEVLLRRVGAGELTEGTDDVEMNEAVGSQDGAVVIVGGHDGLTREGKRERANGRSRPTTPTVRTCRMPAALVWDGKTPDGPD
jgi:hypothetical protein